MMTVVHKKNAIGLSFKDTRRQQFQFLFGKKRYWIQLLIWIALSAFISSNTELMDIINEVYIIQYKDELRNQWFIKYAIIISLIISIFINYIFLLFIIPYAKWKLQTRWIYAAIIGFLLLYILAVFLITFSSVLIYGKGIHDITWFGVLTIIFVFIIVLYFPSIFYFIDIYEKQKSFKNYSLILEEKLQAESQFLSAQINPHFLFNTLNNIYALILSNDQDATKALATLEGLIHYINDESQEEWIDLNAEIDFIKNYLNLEKLRNKQHKISIIFEIDGAIKQHKIAPLILIAFIENAFKHGVNKNEKHSTVRIRIDATDAAIHFSIVNNKNNQKENEWNKNVGGVGLTNVKRRLAMSYPNQHSIKIRNTRHEYQLQLTLQKRK